MNISTEMPGRAASAVLAEAAIDRDDKLTSPRNANANGGVKSRRSLSFGMRSASKRGAAPASASKGHASPDSGAPNMGTVDLTSRLHAQLFD